MTELILPVTGMTCGGCAASVEKALLRQPGVSTAKASLEKAAVEVTFDSAQADRAALAATIRQAGFETP